MSQDQDGREGPRRPGDDSALRSDSRARLRAAPAPLTRQGFGVRFDRYFHRVYAYVSRRVSDTGTCERIVSEALTANVDLLMERADEMRQLCSIKAFSDRLIELEIRRKAAAGRRRTRMWAIRSRRSAAVGQARIEGGTIGAASPVDRASDVNRTNE